MSEEEFIKNELKRLDQLWDQIDDAYYKNAKEGRHLRNLQDKVAAQIRNLEQQLDPPKLEPK